MFYKTKDSAVLKLIPNAYIKIPYSNHNCVRNLKKEFGHKAELNRHNMQHILVAIYRIFRYPSRVHEILL